MVKAMTFCYGLFN